jgi:hypothetical protein
VTLAVAVVSEVACEMALVPVVWLTGRTLRGYRPGAAYWWLAGAFAVSWLADTAAHWTDPWLVGLVYPVSQAALIGAVLLDRSEATLLVWVLVWTAIAAALWEHVQGPDVLVRTVAWGSVTGLAYERPALGMLRRALLVSFGLGWLCWLAYALAPGWSSWGAYQAVRLAGLLLFCAACCANPPHWKVIR